MLLYLIHHDISALVEVGWSLRIIGHVVDLHKLNQLIDRTIQINDIVATHTCKITCPAGTSLSRKIGVKIFFFFIILSYFPMVMVGV